MSEISVGPAVATFILLSLLLESFLSFGVLSAVNSFCSTIGISGRSCIVTDDQSVWYLALPLIACPLYVACMLLARTTSKSAKHGVLR